MVAVTKLTDEVIQAICARKRADQALTQDSLAAEFNLNRNSIKKALVMLNVPAGDDTGIRLIDFELIIRSSLNPRKTFPAAELAELAEGIAVNGLLQNLVVRDAQKSSINAEGHYILVAGERRYRAIGLLREQGRWEGPLPCRVIDADDGTHLALALLENLQRQDVAPLEEADAFLQLQQIDPTVWTAPAIAAKIGRTPRYVYGRLALANKLAPETRAALAAGRINIEAARMLTSVDVERQVEVLDAAAEYDDEDNTREIHLDSIKQEIANNLISVDDAIFDVAASALEIIELDGTNYFVDRKAAIQLQMQAVKTKAKSLKKIWAFVTVSEPGEYFYSSDWEACKDKTKAGVVISITRDTYQVTIREGIVQKVKATPKSFDQKEFKAKAEQARLEREAKEKAELERYTALAPKLPTDWADGEVRAADCADGCKWRVLLCYSAPAEFHVCTKPGGPRAGLLTHEHQGGNGCFEVA
jgi:ParB/RepB/Spo0J family partition protein